MVSLEERVLSNYGGIMKNNLLNNLDFNISEIENIDNIYVSPYYSPGETAIRLKDKFNEFSIVSLNCQSLNVKYDQLTLFLNNFSSNRHICFSAICLQETWIGENHDISLFIIPNYTCIVKPKHCSEHGGLVTYLHESFTYEIYNFTKSAIWEGLIIKILGNDNEKKYLFS